MAHELAAGLDDRARALGDQLAASPEPWLARRSASWPRTPRRAARGLRPPGRDRRGLPGSRRDHRPQQAISPEPHRGNPELDDMRQAAIRALEIRDETEIIRA